MNLEDLAKKTIDEVSKQVSSKDESTTKKALDDEVSFEIAQAKLVDNERIDENISDTAAAKAQSEAAKEQIIDLNAYEKNIEKHLQNEPLEPISVQESVANTQNLSATNTKTAAQNEAQGAPSEYNETLFLKNLRERILVLFEGLKSTKDEDLKARLELCINFLEFLLANIENKLKK